MTGAQIDQAKARITPHVVNLLSSTEGNLVAVTPLDTPEDRKWQRLVPGRVIELVDDSGRPVPLGETGRVRVSTEGGPDRYLYNEAATRDFFKDGYFYPGDLGVLRADGRLALQGRLTDVINVRGDKISPGPIESRLTDSLGVGAVCLFSMPDDNGEEEIHVVVETPVPIEPDRMATALRQELRGFARARVHYVPALWRNTMGKILRREVRAEAAANRPPFLQIGETAA